MSEQNRNADLGRAAADLIELVARATVSMSPAERAARLHPVLLRAALRQPLKIPLDSFLTSGP